MTTIPIPRQIRRVDGGRKIEIQWAADHAGLFDARDLRLMCQCAGCVEEMTGRAMLDPSSVPAEVHAQAIRLVGAYAVHFAWSDGHSTGIYPWERLRAACPCPMCAGAR